MANEKIKYEINVDTSDAKKNVDDLGKSINNTKEETAGFNKQLDATTGGKFGALKGAISSAVTGFKSLKVAIISTGIGALAIGILAVAKAFTSSEEGQNKFAKIMGVIGAVTGQFVDLLAELGSKIIWVFENPKQAIENFVKLIKENIINRFVGLLELIPKIGEAIGLVFEGEFSKAGKVAADAMGKVVLGVENVTDKINEATSALGNFIKETTKEMEIAAKIADQRAKADKLSRALLVERAIADKERADLLEKAVDKERYSLEERIGFLQEASRIEQEITNKEIQAAQLRLAAKQAENALGLSTKEDLDEEAQLKADLINLEAARLRKQKLVTTQISALRNQELAEAKKVADEEAANLQKLQDLKDELYETEKNEKIKKLNDEREQRIKALEEVVTTEEEKAALLLAIEQKYIDAKNEIIEADKQAKAEKEAEETQAKLDKLSEEAESDLLDWEAKRELLAEQRRLLLEDETLSAEERQEQLKVNAQKEEELEKRKRAEKYKTLDTVIGIFGAETKMGRAFIIAKGLMQAKELIMDVSKTIAFSAQAAARSTIAVAEGAAQTAKIGFPQNVPMLISYAAQAVGIISSIRSAVKGAKSVSMPEFSNVTASPPDGANQLAAQNSQALANAALKPTRAYVVAGDVSTAQSMERNIIQGSSI